MKGDIEKSHADISQAKEYFNWEPKIELLDWFNGNFEKMKLLIGGSSTKIFHLQEFVKALEKLNVECKLVFDADYADGFPSRKLGTWFATKQ